MVTGVRLNGNNDLAMFGFYGLSTDTKPTETWKGTVIENGSSYLAIDTQKVTFYDRENETWPEPT